jgi:diguanylate cyclase (GGDEF)-like protein
MQRMRGGDDLNFERWEIVRADGMKRAIAISTSVLTAADDSVHVLGLMHDLTAEEDLRRQARLARTDELTSLRNRRGFEEDATLVFRLARRQGQCITVGFLDIARFKALNDAQGHLEGDRALQAVGEVLSKTIRSTDVVGRIGGDEFAVALPATDAAGAKIFLSRLEDRLLDAVRSHGWNISFNVGAASFSRHVPDLHEALEKADALMYQAKKSGKSCVVEAQLA